MSKKDQIIQAAAQLFCDKGYAATTMRDLAKAVGMEAASLYNHISSKQSLLSGLLLDMARRYTEGMARVEASADTPRQKLEALVALHIRIAVEYPAASALMVGEWRHLAPADLETFRRMRKAYEQHFGGILEAGMASGDFRRLDKEVALFSILSTLRWFHAWYARKGEVGLEALQQEFSEVLLSGIVSNR